MGEQQFKRYKRPVLGLMLGVIIGLAVAVGLGSVLPWRPAPRKPDVAGAHELPRMLFKAPSFENLKNQLDHTVSSKEFAGKVQLVTFMYPGCTRVCPILASRMINLETLLRQRGLENKVALLSFNVDPQDSGPQQMRQFMQQYGADPTNGLWQFVTGSTSALAHVIRQGYHANYKKVTNRDGHAEIDKQAHSGSYRYLPRMKNPLVEENTQGYEVIHANSAIIVGPNGEVRYVLPQANMVSEAVMLNDIIRVLQSGKGV